MVVQIDQSICMKCGRCIKACPEAALDLTSFGVLCNPKLCNNCKKCIEICPVNAIKLVE
ncbi:MAG: 4Fe-4S binding protein [Candidatus Aenigmarchaeota archaeon]|nr:4Fe-4S binding protein [Candidatus Aenigmarchaeota archaeon]